MRAVTVLPGVLNSVQLDDIPEPPLADGEILVRTLALGICGTDHEILEGFMARRRPARSVSCSGMNRWASWKTRRRKAASCRAIMSSVSCGVPIRCRVRPVRPANGICAATEAIPNAASRIAMASGRSAFASSAGFAVKVDRALGLSAVLMEPTSIVAKAWDHVERVGRRSEWWTAENVLVTGAGPIGLLAAMMGEQRNLKVHVLDRNAAGPKPELDSRSGRRPITPASSRSRDVQFDVVMECTAATPLIVEAMKRCAPSGIVCLLGVSSPGSKAEFDIGGFNRKLVLNNEVVFGAVNANLGHYRQAADALNRADRKWLDRLITRRVPLANWREAFIPRKGEIKVVLSFSDL